jgi:ribosomal protein S27E
MRCRKCSHEFTSVHIAGIVRTDWQCSACGKMACAPSGWNTGGMWGYFKDGKFVPEGWQS